MGRLGNALFLVAMFVAPAFAAEMPTRKAGLWEVTTPVTHCAMTQALAA